MPIIKRHCIEDGFAQINNELLQRKDLSYGAKGLLCELLSRPEDWTVIKNQLIRSHTTKYRLNLILKELQTLGYMKVEPIRGERGKITDNTWFVSSNPAYRVNTPNAANTEHRSDRTPVGSPLQIKSNTNKEKDTKKYNSHTKEIKNTIPPEVQLARNYIAGKMPWNKFIEAYEDYPGTKGSEGQMFACFRRGCKSEGVDENNEVDKLSPAIGEQISRRQKKRQAGKFVPEWKNMAGWLTGACWLETEGTEPEPNQFGTSELNLDTPSGLAQAQDLHRNDPDWAHFNSLDFKGWQTFSGLPIDEQVKIRNEYNAKQKGDNELHND